MKYLVILATLCGVLLAQETVKAIPSHHEMQQVFTADSCNGVTPANSTAISIKNWEGPFTVLIDVLALDDAVTPTSVLNIDYQLYHIVGSGADETGHWAHYYADGDSLTDGYDIPAEKLVNLHSVYLNLANLTSISSADSIRLFAHLSVAADSCTIDGWIGGQ